MLAYIKTAPGCSACCPTSHRSQNQGSRKEHKDTGLQLREARGQAWASRSKSKVWWEPMGTNPVGFHLEGCARGSTGHGTGQPSGKRLQPVPCPAVPELGSSTQARVHRDSEVPLRQTLEEEEESGPQASLFERRLWEGSRLPNRAMP